MNENTILSKIEPPSDILKWWPSEDIAHIEKMLRDKFSDNPTELYEQLADISAWQSTVLTLLADANAILDSAERKALMTRNDDWTDLDRRVRMKDATRVERRARDILQGFADTIQAKQFLGMNFRKSAIGERPDLQRS
jgi:Asp-tRNA(Asn)/Glu-tRNA(Gln) amidotransferase C subunit